MTHPVDFALKKGRQHDLVMTALLAVFTLLNCGVFDYSTLFLGWVKYRSFVNFAIGLLLVILFKIFRLRKEKDSYDRYFRRPLFWILLLYSGVFLYDLLHVFSEYQNTALPLLLNQILVVYIVCLLLKYRIRNFPKFLLRIQFVLGLVALLVCLQYFFPAVFLQGKNVTGFSIEGETIRRYTHTAYHLAMVSFFILVVQLFSGMKYKKPQWGFLAFNLLLQSVSILVANYRATMILSFLFLLSSLFWFYVISGKGLKRLRGIALFSVFVIGFIFVFSYQIDWFQRVKMTSSILQDKNMVFRFDEIREGMKLLKTPAEFFFGVGYIKFFYFYNDMFKTFFLHNGFASILFNFGIIGCLFFLNLIVKLFLGITKKFRKYRVRLFFISLGYLLVLMGQNFSSGVFTREPSALLGFGIFILILHDAEWESPPLPVATEADPE